MQQMIDEAGNIWNVDAQGNPVSFAGSANQGGGVQIRPADPARQYAGPKAATDLEGSQLDNDYKRMQIRESIDGKLPPGWRRTPDGGAEPIPGVPIARSATEIAAEAKADSEAKRSGTIRKLMTDVRSLYERDLKGGWPNAISGRVPALIRPENEEFNAAANGILPLIRPLVAQTAKEGDSDKEMEVFMSYIPKSSDSDQTIERKLNMLDVLIEGMAGGKAPSETDRDATAGVLTLGGRPVVRAEDEVPPPIAGGGGPSGGDMGGDDARQRDSFIGSVDAFGRNFANAASLGLADTIAAAGNAVLPIDNLFGANNRSIWDGSSLSDAYNANLALQRRVNAADRQANWKSSMAGDVGGSIAGMVGANALLTRGGAGQLVARTGGAAGDVAYGTTRGAVENGPTGALVGGGSALAGNAAGRYVLAPLATKAAGTQTGQAIINTAARGGNAIANAGRGALGRQPVPFRAPPTPPPALSGGERIAMSRLPDDATQQLAEAQRLGLPLAPVDTSPQLQTLGGSVARKSPDAYAMARENLGGRALGQADRAQEQIARNFGPIANPNEISDRLLQQARDNSRPLYQAFEAEPSRTSDVLEELLARPAGRQGIANARTIAANEGRDPNKMGFDLDDQGEVVLRHNPSPTTLDYTKGGIDDVLEGYRNPITGQLDLDRRGRAIEGLRQDYVTELDRLYPNTYPQARAAYAGPAAERAALLRGRGLANASPRDVQDAMATMTPGQQEQFRLGQRVAMADAVDRVRYSSNPYQNIYGSPVAQQRAAVVFGEGPAAQMGRVYNLEQRMAQSAYDTLGGSPTAMREAADEAFDSPMATAVDMGFSAATGGGGVPELGRKAANFLKDTYRLGASKKKADQLAPLLFQTNPAEAIAAIEALGRKSAARDVYVKRARKTGGLFGASLGSAAALPLIQ